MGDRRALPGWPVGGGWFEDLGGRCLPPSGGSLRYVFEYAVFFLATLFWIARRVWHRPDLVWINSPPDFLIFAAIPAKFLGIPIVLDVHDPMPELLEAKGRASRLLSLLLTLQEKASVRFAGRTVTVHEPMRELLHQRSPAVSVDVVMNVPDTSKWPAMDHDQASRTIVYTGTVAFRYGIDDLVRGMATAVEEIPELRLRIVGDGEDVGLVADLVGELGLDDRVEMTGRVPWTEVRTHLSDAWIGANLPKPDALGHLSFSNKVVEWVALGIPVLASRTATLERYFSSAALFYVSPGSPEEVADALMKLDQLSDEETVGRIQSARESLDQIGWTVQRRELLRIIAEVTASAAR